MKRLLRAIWIGLIVFQTIACTQTTTNKNTISSESSIEFSQSGNLNSRLFGSWSDHEVISSASSLSLTSSIEQNASLVMMDNNRFVSWGLQTKQADSSLNLTQVFSKDINELWINNSPLTSLNQPPRLGKNLKLQHINGQVMAVWEESNSIFSRLFIPGFGWNTTTLHGVGNRFHLSESANASFLLVWYLADQNGSGFQAQHYDVQSGWGKPYSLSDTGNINFAVDKPVQLTNGNYLFSWVNELSGALTLQSARFDTRNGWAASVLISDVNVAAIEKIDVVVTDNNNAKLFTKNYFSSAIYGIHERDYRFNLGFDEIWSEPSLFVDPYKNPNPSPFLDYKIAVSPVNQDFSFVWISDLDDGKNQYQVIQWKNFTVNGGWGEAKILATPLFRYSLTAMPEFSDVNPSLQSLVVNQASLGRLDIAWLQVSDNNIQLKATQLSTSGIVENAEIIVTVPAEETITNIKLSSNSSNESQIVWLHQKSEGAGDTFSLLGSSKTGIVGGQPITFDPNQPQPVTHMATSDSCLSCHDISGAIVVVDHSQVFGTCINCHNSVIAVGQPSFHMPTTNNCDACHSTMIFIPAITVDHNEVIGSCISCHNGAITLGKSINHLPTTNTCEACHSTGAFLPAISVDHSELIGLCIDCHNGIVALGKHPNHIATTDNCEACHLTNNWVPVFAVDHMQTIGSCDSCHSPAPITHIVVGAVTVCETCHSTVSWFNPTNPLPIPSSGPLPFAVWSSPTTLSIGTYSTVQNPISIWGDEISNLFVDRNSSTLMSFTSTKSNPNDVINPILSNQWIVVDAGSRGWQQYTPIDPAETSRMSAYKTELLVTGNVVSSWIDQGNLYFAEHDGLQWSTPTLLAPDVRAHWIYVSENSVVFLWSYVIGNVYQLAIQRFTNGVPEFSPKSIVTTSPEQLRITFDGASRITVGHVGISLFGDPVDPSLPLQNVVSIYLDQIILPGEWQEKPFVDIPFTSDQGSVASDWQLQGLANGNMFALVRNEQNSQIYGLEYDWLSISPDWKPLNQPDPQKMKLAHLCLTNSKVAPIVFWAESTLNPILPLPKVALLNRQWSSASGGWGVTVQHNLAEGDFVNSIDCFSNSLGEAVVALNSSNSIERLLSVGHITAEGNFITALTRIERISIDNGRMNNVKLTADESNHFRLTWQQENTQSSPFSYEIRSARLL